MTIYEKKLHTQTLEAFLKFIKSTPAQITLQIALESDFDIKLGCDLYWKLFRRTSDYSAKEWGWVKNLIDSIEVPPLKRKEDPLNPFLMPDSFT